MKKTNRFLPKRELILMGIILVITIGVGIRNPEFVSLKSIRDIFTDNSLLMMLVIGQMMVIITKGIDLSIASNIALTGMSVALFNQAFPHFPMIGIILMAAIIGLSLGAFNGLFVSVFNIPPIVVTLGTMSVFRGLTFVLSGGEWVNAHEMTEAFQGVPQLTFLGLSTMIWFAIATVIAATIFLYHTRTGRSIYGLGGNPLAAQYVGISKKQILFLVYTLNGLICGLVGYFWVARYALASSEVGMGLELEAIAGCVIGGVSIAGGVGPITGALLGALFLGVIGNALPVLNVSPFWQMAISGAVILMAVIINSREEKHKGKIILRKAIKQVG
jgi:rhamnose transport system permease protein